MKKFRKKTITSVVIFGLLFSNYIPTFATNTQYILENEFISRTYATSDHRFKTVSILNKVTSEEDNIVTPTEASEEFKLTLKDTPVVKNWTVEVSNESTSEGAGNTKAAIIDGNPETFWHSCYNRNCIGTLRSGYPYYAAVTFDVPKTVKSFIYTPRNIFDANGNAGGYNFYVQTQGSDEFEKVISQGNFQYNGTKPIQVNLPEAKNNVAAIKLEITSGRKAGDRHAAIAELDVSDKTVEETQSAPAVAKPNEIVASQLQVKENGVTQSEADGVKTLRVEFEPVERFGAHISVAYVARLGNNDKFIRSHLEISAPEAERSNFTIDTIDLQSLQVEDSRVLWKLPAQANISEMGGFDGFYAGLGQPVYLKGALYTGSEFPLAHNTVESGKLFSRYYSGKTLAQLPLENGAYRTWPVVVGAARNNLKEVVQQDFYGYLRQVGTETTFRKQYNSWFDFMKNFDAEKIQSSFKEIDDGFTSYGVAPLNSYVVDDGWQNAHSVWDINRERFPNQLYDSSRDVKRLGSDFGLWLGPQGGYGETTGPTADAAVRENKGSRNGGVVNVGDKRYVDYLKQLLSSYQDKFDINYWKLDGMLLHPLSATTEHYIGGGYKNMYSMTETHERWIELYKLLRQNRHGKDLWINLTSYINPSPWFLQWVNSIWMQNAGDVDYQDHVKRYPYNNIDFGNDAAEAITYRDDRYEEVVKLRDWQLPFSNIYNHDPVYGLRAHESKNRAPIQFSTDDLRDYLYMLGTRGTGFWEFYYSYKMFDDAKWQVNAEAVNWIETNFEILRNAKLHGGKPGRGEVYGYSAWTENEGIVSIRNPHERVQTYTFTFDNTKGMYQNNNTYYSRIVHGNLSHAITEGFQYGKELTVTLQPYETLIYQFSSTQDVEGPKVIGKRFMSENKLQLEFDEKLDIRSADFSVEGKNVTATKLDADLRTVELTFDSAIEDKTNVNVNYSGVKDTAGVQNASEGSLVLTQHDNGIILSVSNPRYGETIENTGVEKREEFTVSLTANLTEYDQVLAQQGEEWKLSVDAEGRVVFTVKGTTVKSAPFTQLRSDDRGNADAMLPKGQDVAIKAVRFENGSLRIYIDGTVSNSAYSKEHAKAELEKAPIKIGQSGLQGTIKDFKLHQDALKYNVIAKEEEARKETDELVQIHDVKVSSFDSSENATAGSAIDNIPSTYWASAQNKNNNTEKQYLTLEFERPEEVKAVRYLPRQVAQATGNITKPIIEYSLDGEEWTPFPIENEVVWSASDISLKTVLATAPVTAKYIRLGANESYHWSQGQSPNKPDKRNTIVNAAEFSAWKDKSSAANSLTTIYLEQEISNLEQLIEESYTAETYAKVTEVVKSALELLGGENVSQSQIDAKVEELKAAHAQLRERKYTLTVNAEHGTVERNKTEDSFAPNTKVTLTATADEGYRFVEWKKDGSSVSTEATYEVTMTEDITIEAVFAVSTPDPVTLTDADTTVKVVVHKTTEDNVNLILSVEELEKTIPGNKLEDSQVYDISLMDEAGAKYPLNGSAKVSLPIKEGRSVKAVYHLVDGEITETIIHVVNEEENTVEFTTTHFSEYAVAYEPVVKVDENPTEQPNDGATVDNPTTPTVEKPATEKVSEEKKQVTPKKANEKSVIKQVNEVKKEAAKATKPKTDTADYFYYYIALIIGACAVLFGIRKNTK